MRKGQPRFNTVNIPIHFEPMGYQYLPPEVFVDVTPIMVPNVQPYYMVSNYGRVWHKYRQTFLTPNLDTKGYLYKCLATTESNNGAVIRIHRLVMLAFNYRPDHENFIVDHKNGIKTDCCITNLEWVDASENTKRAWDLGLKGNYYTDDQIHEVCRLLESGKFTVADIAKQVGVSYACVSSVLGKRVHCDISDNYNIEQRKIANNLTEDQVRLVCEFFQANKGNFVHINDYCRAAMNALNLNESTNMLKTLQKIYSKQSYAYISKYYDF